MATTLKICISDELYFESFVFSGMEVFSFGSFLLSGEFWLLAFFASWKDCPPSCTLCVYIGWNFRANSTKEMAIYSFHFPSKISWNRVKKRLIKKKKCSLFEYLTLKSNYESQHLLSVLRENYMYLPETLEWWK